jgi:uncharacterized RDD family membrane protein YckC
MFCSKCGANVADGAAFCAACGQPVPGVEVVSAATYGNSGSVIRPPVEYAGFWLRFVAVIIDGIVLWIVGAIITFPLIGAMGLRGLMRGGYGPYGGGPMTPADMLPFFSIIFRFILISAVLKWLYYALLESSSWQATLGKKALGLEVTDLEGHRISFGRATGRTFAKIISAMILYIGFMMAGFTDKKQALHDMMAGTLVIRKT